MLTRSNVITYRATGICLLLVAAFEKVLYGTLFLSYLLTLISLSIILARNSSILRMLPKSLLILSFYYEVLLLIGVRIPFFANTTTGNLIVLTPMIICGSIAYFRIPATSEPRNYSVAVFTGSTCLISFLTFAYMKFGGVLTWAMSGDSRNHVYQMRAVIDRGGITLFDGYPGLANGIAGLLGGWQYNSNSAVGGHLGSEIHILGLASVLSIVFCSLISGLFIHKKSDKHDLPLGIASSLISLIPISQVFLNTYFTEGFFPSAFSLAILMAVFYEVTKSNSTPISKFLICIIGSALIYKTFPLLLPLLLPCFFLSHIGLRSLDSLNASLAAQIKNKIQLISCLALPVLIIELGSRIEIVSKYLTLHLNNYGRISPIDSWGLWMLTLTAALLFVFSAKSNLIISASTLVAGVVSIQFSEILDRLLTEVYYLNKFVWMCTTLMLILNLITLASFFSSAFSFVKKMAIGVIFTGLLPFAILPLLQDFPIKPSLVTLTTSPKYPSVEDAHLITYINGQNSRSIFWGVSTDFLATQVIDIWMTLGFDFDHGAYAWGYNSDVFSLDAVCSFAKANQPTTIWVLTKDVQKLVHSFCAETGVITKVIPT